MATTERRPYRYIVVTSENNLYLRGTWPRNTWADPRHQPTDTDEKDWLSQTTTAFRKRITLRLMYSHGSWPDDAYENIILAAPIPHQWLYGAPMSIFERLCEEQFDNTALLQFDINRQDDIDLLCFSDPMWNRIAPKPRYDHFEDKCTYVLHALPKYVQFVKRDDDSKTIVLKIKLHDQAADIVKCLAEALGFGAHDELVASHRGANAPLSWLTLPHNPHDQDNLDIKVIVTKKGVEDVEYSYSVTNLQEMFEDLSVIAKNKFSNSRKKSDEEYRKRLHKYWNDLSADLILQLPKPCSGIEPYHVSRKHGVDGKQYRRIGETLSQEVDETLKPFSTWSTYFKHCLVLLAQMTPGERPAAMNILYWCVFVRNCQGTDNLKTVCEALHKDLRLALQFFDQYKKANSQGRLGIEKWNKASPEERLEIIGKGKAAHKKLEALHTFDAKAQLDLDIEKLLDKIRHLKKDLADTRKMCPREVELEEALEENIAFFNAEKGEVEAAKRRLNKEWADAPKLSQAEVMDLLYYEHFAFKQKCLRERRASGQVMREVGKEDDEEEDGEEADYGGEDSEREDSDDENSEEEDSRDQGNKEGDSDDDETEDEENEDDDSTYDDSEDDADEDDDG